MTESAGEVASPFEKIPIADDLRRDPRQIIGNALVHAAAWGRAEVVDFLLARGAQINLIPAGFDYAGTPLHYAAHRGQREVVDQLLRNGADPTVLDAKVGQTADGWADHGGYPDLAGYLREVRGRVEHEAG